MPSSVYPITASSSGGGGAPTGTAGGELAGTYPNPTIADGVIDDANIVAGGLTHSGLAAAAGITSGQLAGSIALAKLATDPLARANHTGTQTMSTISDAGSLATKSAVASADITDGTIVNADINASAAIAYSKLALTGSVVVGDFASSVVGAVGGTPKIVRRTADATARTNNTLTDDDTLLWAIGASDVWAWRMYLRVNAANTTMDAKIAVSAPTGATGGFGFYGQNTAQGTLGIVGTAATPIAESTYGGTGLQIGTLAGTNAVTLEGVVHGDGSHSGNVTLRWAQNTTDAGNLTILADSYLIAWRLA